MTEETQKSLIEYKPKKDIFDVLNAPVKNTTKLNLLRKTIGNPKTRLNASRLLKVIKFDLITKAIFNIKDENDKWKHKFSKESLVKAVIWKQYCTIRKASALFQILSRNEEIARNLGFEDKIPSAQVMRVFENYLLRDNYIKKILFKIIKKMNKEIRRHQKWK